MEGLLILIAIVSFFILWNILQNHSTTLKKISEDNSDLKDELRKLSRKLDLIKGETSIPAEKVTRREDKPSVANIKEEPVANVNLPVSEEIPQPVPLEPKQIVTARPSQPVLKPVPTPVAPKKTRFQAWLQDNPDIEKFIGENLVNKIGKPH